MKIEVDSKQTEIHYTVDNVHEGIKDITYNF